MMGDEPPFRSISLGERRERIVLAAKRVFLEKGLDASSMEDVAARAGTTKPTVYAHFKSKDELFAAVIELVRGKFLGGLRSPDDHGAEPVEAITRFCGRFLELVSWCDIIGYQRATLAVAARSPANAQAVYDTLFAASCRTLSAYLQARGLSCDPERYASLILVATTGEQVIRHLYGVATPLADHPDGATVGKHCDLDSIRQTVELIAGIWNR